MKKLFIISAVILVASCKKDRTCTCNIDGINGTIVAKDMTKRQAKNGPCASYTETIPAHSEQQSNGTFIQVPEQKRDVTCKLD